MSALVLRFRSHRPSTTVRKSVPDLPNRSTNFDMGERHAPLSPSRRSRLGPPLTRESRACHAHLAELQPGLGKHRAAARSGRRLWLGLGLALCCVSSTGVAKEVDQLTDRVAVLNYY